MKHRILMMAAVALLGAGSLAAPALAGPLDGATIHTQYLFPDANTVYQDYGETLISGNTLLTDDLGGNHGIDLYATGSTITADFSQSGAEGDYWYSQPFNGFTIFDDTGTAAPITSVTINGLTNMVGFDASRISFDADQISINWQGLDFDANTKLGLTLNSVSAAPEPGTWMMMILGFGLIGGVLRAAYRKSEKDFTAKVRSLAAA